jgi:hypothetical protein
MKKLSELLTFTVPLNAESYSLAEQFSIEHSQPHKAKEVYFNILAVSAVKFYLRCMGIETNWDRSFSSNALMQTLLNVADLEVIGVGKIECRPVMPADNLVRIPLEVCLDRIAYVIVQIDEKSKRATILGFSKTVPKNEELPIDDLQSLEDLLLLLSQPIAEVKQPIHLSQWLKNIVDIGWETVEFILSPQQQAKLAFRSRTSQNSDVDNLENSSLSIERGKLLYLGQDLQSERVGLLVELISNSEDEIDIWVKVFPFGNCKHLPEELQLFVLDELETVVMQANARNTENMQLNFSSTPGESFSVKLVLHNATFTEHFLV